MKLLEGYEDKTNQDMTWQDRRRQGKRSPNGMIGEDMDGRREELDAAGDTE